jgi:LPS sulfotransferase NodH
MGRALGPDEIVVVAGVPRSGTSLLMQMLAAGGIAPHSDGVRAADPDNPRGYLEHEAAKRLARDSGWLAEARGRAVKVVHVLVPELPPRHAYRVLLVERRLDEVLASQERMLARREGREVGPDLPAPDERLAAAFRAQLETARCWLEAQPNVEWLRVRHADLIGDPAGSAARIADFLGEGLDRAAMAAAVEPALHRVRADAG